MRDKILEHIRRLAAANGGRPPGRRLFEQETGIAEGAWQGVYWARWGDAVTDAGFEPNKRPERLDDDFFMERLADACRHYKKIPTMVELRLYRRNIDPRFPTHSTLHRHIPTKDQLFAELKRWTNQKEQFKDVAEMLEKVEPSAMAPSNAVQDEGFVYLVQFGAYHKIGRSDQIERRMKEIRIALPDAGKMIHVIRTDDPSGIEAYWHRRFESRRANGEWFKLSASDIAGFKRRKFQ